MGRIKVKNKRDISMSNIPLSAPKKPHRYEEIWTRIKSKGECALICNTKAKKSIIQGVKKRKYLDIEFKFANEHETLYLDIFSEEVSDDTVKILFKLRQFPGIEELVLT